MSKRFTGRLPDLGDARGSASASLCAGRRARPLACSSGARVAPGVTRPARSRVFSWAAEPDDRDEEGREEDLRSDCDDGEGQDRKPFLPERAEAVCSPLADDDSDQGEAAGEHEKGECEAVLEPQLRTQPFEEVVLLADEVDPERSRAQTKPDRLHADQDQ